MGYLSILSGVLTLLVKVYEQFWSDSAILARLKQKQTDVRLSQATEAVRLSEEYAKIAAQHREAGQALADALNKQFPKP